MSGFKVSTVAISRDVLEKFKETGLRQRQIQPEPEPVKNGIAEISRESIDSSVKAIENRIFAFQENLSGIDHRLNEFEQTSTQRLLQQEEALFATIQDHAGHLLENLSSLHRFMEEQFLYLAEEERRARIEQMTDLDTRIQAIETRYLRMRDMGIGWLDAASRIVDITASFYQHEFFAPGHIDRLNQLLDLSRHNLDQGAFEAALTIAQQGYLDGSQLRLDLEKLENEYFLDQQAVLEGLRQLYARQESNRFVEAVDFNGNGLEVKVDVNAWTGGGLDSLEADLIQCFDRIIAGIPSMDTQGLVRIANEYIPLLKQRLQDLITNAQATALSAQVRINIADLVVQALESQGFSLDDGQYSENNLALDYKARLHSLDGSEVEIIVSPVQDQPLENNLAIVSHDSEQRSEHELRIRAKEVAEWLSREGLSVSAFQEKKLNQGKPRTHGKILGSIGTSSLGPTPH